MRRIAGVRRERAAACEAERSPRSVCVASAVFGDSRESCRENRCRGARLQSRDSTLSRARVDAGVPSGDRRCGVIARDRARPYPRSACLASGFRVRPRGDAVGSRARVANRASAFSGSRRNRARDDDHGGLFRGGHRGGDARGGRAARVPGVPGPDGRERHGRQAAPVGEAPRRPALVLESPVREQSQSRRPDLLHGRLRAVPETHQGARHAREAGGGAQGTTRRRARRRRERARGGNGDG